MRRRSSTKATLNSWRNSRAVRCYSKVTKVPKDVVTAGHMPLGWGDYLGNGPLVSILKNLPISRYSWDDACLSLAGCEPWRLRRPTARGDSPAGGFRASRICFFVLRNRAGGDDRATVVC